ncbi:MAG: glycosyltransferase [Aquificota bacterium]|nr:MAG: glycosyltransferase [Aquificota bacterium]
MRILSVVDGIGWGGTKEQTYLLARELSKRGFEVHMALAYEYTQMVEKLKGYPVKFRFFEHHSKNSRLNPANYYRLWKIIKEGGYDFVIANSPHSLDFVSVVYRFLKRKPKLIVVKRSARKPSFVSLKLKYMTADMIVAVSQKVKEVMLKAGVPEEKLRVIRSGVDLSRFYPDKEEGERLRKELGIPQDWTVFLNVANWNPPVKGQDRLIQTFSRLRCEKCLLLLVGYDTDIKAREYAKAYGLEGRLLGVGYQEETRPFYNACDFFVLSSYLEGFPNALLQAMACGKPVITTLAGGAGEVVKEGYNGFAVLVGDWEGLLQKMEKALSLSKEDYERLSYNAILSAKDFSIEKTVEGYVELFEELLAC